LDGVKHMQICKLCIQPDTRPGIYFNEEGVCGACLWEEKKNKLIGILEKMN